MRYSSRENVIIIIRIKQTHAYCVYIAVVYDIIQHFEYYIIRETQFISRQIKFSIGHKEYGGQTLWRDLNAEIKLCIF